MNRLYTKIKKERSRLAALAACDNEGDYVRWFAEFCPMLNYDPELFPFIVKRHLPELKAARDELRATDFQDGTVAHMRRCCKPHCGHPAHREASDAAKRLAEDTATDREMRAWKTQHDSAVEEMRARLDQVSLSRPTTAVDQGPPEPAAAEPRPT
jgi:hypothetical protein